MVRATPLTALGEGDVRRTNPKLLHSTRQHREQVKKTEQETKRSDTRVRERKRTFSTANFTLAKNNNKNPPRTGRGLKGPEICLELSQCPIHKSTQSHLLA